MPEPNEVEVLYRGRPVPMSEPERCIVADTIANGGNAKDAMLNVMLSRFRTEKANAP